MARSRKGGMGYLSAEQPFIQRDTFVLLNTKTEGEQELRLLVREQADEIQRLTDTIAGLTVILEERYGIDVVSSDEVFNA